MLLQDDAQGLAGTVQDIVHPIMDKVRSNSAAPELAVAFFNSLFQSKPTKRPTAAEALSHPYLADCVQEMQRAPAGNPQCSYLRTKSEADILKCILRASFPAKVGKESAKLAKAVARALVRFATPPQHRKPKQQKQAYPPCDLDWYFPPYVMLQRSAAKPTPSNATAPPQPAAHESTDTAPDTARHGDMHDSAESLLAVCKGAQDGSKVSASSSVITGKENRPVTAPQLSMTDTAKAQKRLADSSDKTNPKVLSSSQGTGFNSVQPQQAIVPQSSTAASKIGTVSTDVTGPLDGLLVKAPEGTATIAVTASCVSSVPDLKRQDSAFQTAAQPTAKAGSEQMVDDEVPERYGVTLCCGCCAFACQACDLILVVLAKERMTQSSRCRWPIMGIPLCPWLF